jgi:hypothetical protein
MQKLGLIQFLAEDHTPGMASVTFAFLPPFLAYPFPPLFLQNHPSSLGFPFSSPSMLSKHSVEQVSHPMKKLGEEIMCQ